MSLDPSILKYFANFIEKEIGIIYSDTNYFQLEHRLNDITTLLGFKDFNELYEKAKSSIHGQMRDMLLDLATNNETSFFRDAGIFKMIPEFIVPEIQKNNPALMTLNIWSAASSTGQEPYSVAISLDQTQKANVHFPSYSMTVTDFSERVLKRTQEGLYSQLEVQRGLPAKLLISYFDKEGENHWRIKSILRSKMQFRQLNLLEPFPMNLGKYDLVLCRNVLIYQRVENKTAVIKKIHSLLNDRGFLILGAAESLIGLSNDFNQVQHGTSVAYQKK
jgi:chemotaxis protein methyltransferase CheR